MDARTIEAEIRAWHGIRLSSRLAAAMAAVAARYVEVTRPAAALLAFDDEPAQFVRVRDATAAGPRPPPDSTS